MSREVIEWEYLSRRKSATEIHDTALKEIELKYQFMLTTGFSPWYFSTQSGYNNFSVIISRKEDIKSLAEKYPPCSTFNLWGYPEKLLSCEYIIYFNSGPATKSGFHIDWYSDPNNKIRLSGEGKECFSNLIQELEILHLDNKHYTEKRIYCGTQIGDLWSSIVPRDIFGTTTDSVVWTKEQIENWVNTWRNSADISYDETLNKLSVWYRKQPR